eukprot:TRINITY_DN9142_c0_g1_i3.p1 TRINITY_DN9142_c0_g1~~TRINITY_DN9142_c0_g1_i3.p1  ORF type:complete len:433 (+),score=126.17 TRINITY_DN9142_c0_g1_i3:47-1345(+)
MNPSGKKTKTENIQQKMKNKVFKIRLRSNQDAKLNENFVGVIEKEFASKYLESLGIEPTSKNINMVLRNYPLKNCHITAGWNNAGMLADTITIVARREKSKDVHVEDSEFADKKNDKKANTQEFFEEMKKVGLKTINLDIFKSIQKALENPDGDKNDLSGSEDEQKVDEERRGRFENTERRIFMLDYNAENIRKRYFFPFGIPYKERTKIEQGIIKEKTAGDRFHLLDSKEFEFPFSQVSVHVNLIKELQTALKISFPAIKEQMDRFIREFPFVEVMPGMQRGHREQKPGDEIKEDEVDNDPKVVAQLRRVLRGDTMIRYVGLNAHFCYWMIFGHTSPFEVDSLFRKQILTTLFELHDTLHESFNSQYHWANFYFPSILVCVRMLTEFILHVSYPNFFAKGNNAEVTLARVNELLTQLYDPNLIFSLSLIHI